MSRGIAAFWVGLVVVAGCLRSSSTTCGDLTCVPGSVCGVLRGADVCLLPGQDTVCGTAADGTPCHGESFVGICDGGYCLPGCGDGRQDLGEQCDDGNFKSHDGCSSACVLEVLAWSEWKGPPFARYRHAAAYNGENLVVVGGETATMQANDYWEREPSGRWSRTVPAPFGTLVLPAMAYDAARGRVVLFGGFDGSGATNSTWEYDGKTWTEVTLTPGPRARYGAAMVFDQTRNRVVLFGGFGATDANPNVMGDLDDTWEYDGTSWTPITTSPRPPRRRQHAMAWDAAQGRAVLFGGQGATVFDDTWVYANGTWTAVTTSTRPLSRLDAAMAFLPARGRVVLFGGRGQSSGGFMTFGDTWELSGSTWTAIAPPLPAPARHGATLTYDAARQRLVLVSGSDSTGRYLEDVWEYHSDGTWQAASPRLYPAARGDTRAVYDSARGNVVMFGGRSDRRVASPLGDTWIFDGVQWSEPVLPSSTRYAHGLTYDTSRTTVVMFGGMSTTGLSADTWEWDGVAWSPHATSGPSARTSPAMADAPGDLVTLFGGDAANEVDERETWQYSGGGWQQLTPAAMPPGGGTAAMVYDPIADRTVLQVGSETWVFAAGEWTRLAGDIPARTFASMVFDTWRERVVLYGGFNESIGGVTNEVWELDGTTWRSLTVSGLQPSPRETPAVAFMPKLRSLVVFGGFAADNLSRADTWLLRYESTTPDEVCDNGQDDDGDLQVDDADPDCTQLVP